LGSVAVTLDGRSVFGADAYCSELSEAAAASEDAGQRVNLGAVLIRRLLGLWAGAPPAARAAAAPPPQMGDAAEHTDADSCCWQKAFDPAATLLPNGLVTLDDTVLVLPSEQAPDTVLVARSAAELATRSSRPAPLLPGWAAGVASDGRFIQCGGKVPFRLSGGAGLPRVGQEPVEALRHVTAARIACYIARRLVDVSLDAAHAAAVPQTPARSAGSRFSRFLGGSGPPAPQAAPAATRRPWYASVAPSLGPLVARAAAPSAAERAAAAAELGGALRLWCEGEPLSDSMTLGKIAHGRRLPLRIVYTPRHRASGGDDTPE
jgi:hypothetical protein